MVHNGTPLPRRLGNKTVSTCKVTFQLWKLTEPSMPAMWQTAKLKRDMYPLAGRVEHHSIVVLRWW